MLLAFTIISNYSSSVKGLFSVLIWSPWFVLLAMNLSSRSTPLGLLVYLLHTGYFTLLSMVTNCCFWVISFHKIFLTPIINWLLHKFGFLTFYPATHQLSALVLTRIIDFLLYVWHFHSLAKEPCTKIEQCF